MTTAYILCALYTEYLIPLCETSRASIYGGKVIIKNEYRF